MSYLVERVEKNPNEKRELGVTTSMPSEALLAEEARKKQAAMAAAQTPVTSPVVEEKAPSSPSSVPEVNPRLAELEARELALATERRAFLAERDKATSTPTAETMTAEQWKAKFLEDPTSTGITYDEMASKYLTQPTEERQLINQLQAQLEELKASQSQGMQSIQQAQKQAYENAKRQLDHDTRELVAARAADFELIATDGAYDQVVQLIEDTYSKDKRLMSVETAAKQVEEKLVERARKYAGVNKIRQGLDAARTIPPSEPSNSAPVSQSTITRALTQTKPALTERQRIARAIAIANGQTPE